MERERVKQIILRKVIAAYFRDGLVTSDEAKRLTREQVMQSEQQPVIRTIQIGKGSIDTVASDARFINGIQAGIMTFYLRARETRQSEETILQLIKERAENTEQSELYQAGFIVGWIGELVQGASI